MIMNTCIDLYFTCISFGEFFHAPSIFGCIISYLCILAFKGIGSQSSSISLYVRIIAQRGCECVVLLETAGDSEKALLAFR